MRNKIIIGLLLIFTTGSVYSQFTVNSPFCRQTEFNIHQDSSAHTQIKPNLYIADTANSHNRHISINPLILSEQSIDVLNKSLFYNFYIGAIFKSHFTKKIFLNFAYYYGVNKPLDFLVKYNDSLNVVPNFGRVSSQKNNNYRYGSFIGNFIYKPADYIYFEAGNGKTFIGDGYRSLLLSDHSSAYPYFKTTVEVWKVKYFYMIARHKNYDLRFPDKDLMPKYTFTHYLSFNLHKRFNISLFETVISSPYDSMLLKRGIEFSYLNPVIFLRPVEYSLGSPDNVLVGFSGHLKIFKSGMLYGQVFIDEFILSHIKSKDEYWDEKYGIQAGMKFYKFLGIKNLYFQAEANAVRPYTYSHANPILSYSNLYQPLAHPLGSNFVEGLGIIGYKFKNFYFQTKVVYAKYGENDTLNYGRNPHLSYISRIDDENINWLQGVPSSLKYADLMLGYKKWDIQFSINFIYREVFSALDKQKNMLVQFNIETPVFNNYSDWN